MPSSFLCLGPTQISLEWGRPCLEDVAVWSGAAVNFSLAVTDHSRGSTSEEEVECDLTTGTGCNHNITGVTPCQTDYTAQIKAKVDGQEVIYVERKTDRVLNAKKSPKDFKVVYKGNRSVQLTWSPYSFCFSHYQICYYGEDFDERCVTTSEIQMTMTGLNDCEQYTFKLQAARIGGDPYANPNATVKQQMIQSIAGLQVDQVDTDSVSVSWQPVTDTMGCGRNINTRCYDEHNVEDVVTSTSQSNGTATFSRLTACTAYICRVERLYKDWKSFQSVTVKTEGCTTTQPQLGTQQPFEYNGSAPTKPLSSNLLFTVVSIALKFFNLEF